MVRTRAGGERYEPAAGKRGELAAQFDDHWMVGWLRSLDFPLTVHYGQHMEDSLRAEQELVRYYG